VKVIENVSIRQRVYDFLVMFYLVSFLRYSMSKNIATLKSGSEVTQGHWKWYHSIDWIWFPIRVLQ